MDTQNTYSIETFTKSEVQDFEVKAASTKEALAKALGGTEKDYFETNSMLNNAVVIYVECNGVFESFSKKAGVKHAS